MDQEQTKQSGNRALWITIAMIVVGAVIAAIAGGSEQRRVDQTAAQASRDSDALLQRQESERLYGKDAWKGSSVNP